MERLQAKEIQKIYGMAAVLGLVDKGAEQDNLHLFIESRTGKTSVKELTQEEYKAVVRELSSMMRLSNLEAPTPKKVKKYDETPGHMTVAQQKKVWRLMYQLREQDIEQNTATLGNRLCGIIKTTFGIDANETEPMKWLSFSQGGQLIETIKRYISSATRRKAKRGG